MTALSAALTYFRSFGFLSLGDVMKLPDPTYLIDQLIPEQGVGMIYGPSAIGKSFLIIDILLSIAAGLLWNDLPTKKGLVVYVVGEGGSGIKIRIAGWLQKWSKRANSLPVVVLLDPVNLYDEESVQNFIKMLVDSNIPIRMVVFDTLSRCSLRADDSNNMQMEVVVDNCIRIQKAVKTFVCYIHHTGKKGDEFRGASCLYANVDVVIGLHSYGRKTNKKIKICVEKQKDGEPLPDMIACLAQMELEGKKHKGQTTCTMSYEGYVDSENDNDDDDGISNLKEGPRKRVQDMLDFVETFGVGGVLWDDVGVYMREERGHKGRSSNISDAKNYLVKKGLIVQNGQTVVAVSCMNQPTQAAA